VLVAVTSGIEMLQARQGGESYVHCPIWPSRCERCPEAISIEASPDPAFSSVHSTSPRLLRRKIVARHLKSPLLGLPACYDCTSTNTRHRLLHSLEGEA